MSFTRVVPREDLVPCRDGIFLRETFAIERCLTETKVTGGENSGHYHRKVGF
jgi:hypothetical protein